MKPLPQRVAQVKRLYLRLDKEIAGFQKESGLQCLSGCGECCKKPDIEATPLEFLPLALELFDRGEAESMHQRLSSELGSICLAFRPHVTNFGGLCSEYPNRGLICRLFGFSARTNKEGQKEIVTCKFIKETQTAEYSHASRGINEKLKIPVMANYYSRLRSIDPSLVDFYPINTALAKALEVVLHYYAYRRRKKVLAT